MNQRRCNGAMMTGYIYKCSEWFTRNQGTLRKLATHNWAIRSRPLPGWKLPLTLRRKTFGRCFLTLFLNKQSSVSGFQK